MKSECASMHEQGRLGACSTLKMRCSEITSSPVIGLKMLLEFQSHKHWKTSSQIKKGEWG